MPLNTHKYSNGEITVIWKPDICIHSGICFRGLAEVFDPRRKPWIEMDKADTQRIIEQVKKCPSGAISLEYPHPLKKQIFLIGFMGSGKTHWGRLWSATNSFSFVDLDDAIEKEKGKTVAKLFEEEGEAHFRQLETATLRSFTGTENVIVACGGGTPCFNNNMQWMNENGITVYLKATPQQLAKRLAKEQQQRPLLHNIKEHELEVFIENKLEEREPFYNQATIILDEEKATTETFKEIVNY